MKHALVNPEKPGRSSPGTTAKLELLQSEAETLLGDLKKVEDSYATQALDLTLALGYIERLISNKNVDRYLAKHHSEILSEFKKQIDEKAMEISRTTMNPDLGQTGRPKKHSGNERNDLSR